MFLTGCSAAHLDRHCSTSAAVRSRFPSPVDVHNWLLDSSHRDAEQLLSNKADGKFLIRRSSDRAASCALSIAWSGIPDPLSSKERYSHHSE